MYFMEITLLGVLLFKGNKTGLVLSLPLQRDICLGEFLHNYCFNTDIHCPNPQCGRSMVDHERSFIHNHGRVNITIEEYGQSQVCLFFLYKTT